MNVICAACGTRGTPATHTRGSFWLEVVLWLCFLVPGLIYSIWRLTSRQKVCRACGSTELVPVDSPRGRKLAAEFASSH